MNRPLRPLRLVHAASLTCALTLTLTLALALVPSARAVDPSPPPPAPVVVRIEGFLPSTDTSASAVATTAAPATPVRRSLGFIVEADGFLLTNYQHLTDPASGRLLEDLRVTFPSDPARLVHPARVIGVEPTLNLGILKIDPPASAPAFPVSKIARGQEPPLATPLAALADDLPDDPSPRGPIASGNLRRPTGTVIALNTRKCYQESLTSTLFRTDLGLAEASVGGPVFVAETGEVVALYTGYKPTPAADHVETPGETFVLPITLCFNIYDSLKQKRSLLSPWTGFSVRPLTAAEAQRFPTARSHRGGVGLEYIWPDSPAEKLGLQVDDVLVQLGYNRIESVADFQKWLYMNGVGQKVKLLILRGRDQYLSADYIIEERPASARPR